MIITDRDRRVLQSLARYGLLNRRQVQKLCFPADPDGRVARRRLAALAEAGLIRRHSMLVASRHDDPPAPVYRLATQGCEHLAEQFADPRYLHKSVKPPHPLHLHHHLAVAEVHIALDAAVAAQTAVTLEAWFNEGDIVNPEEPDPAKHFRLFTEVGDQVRKACAPDAAFLLANQGRRAVFYLELERGDGDRGTGARQLAERKCPGYAGLAAGQLHRRHFPAATEDGFTVLLVAPNAQRRDAIRRAFGKKDVAAHRTDLWRFAAGTDLTAEKFLHGDIFYPCGDDPPGPLTKTVKVSAPTQSAELGVGSQIAGQAGV